MHAMIGGAASSMAAAKRKNIAREKDHMEKLGRPNRLLVNPLLNPGNGSASPQLAHITPSGAASHENPRTPSRSGSFDAVMSQAAKWAPPPRYGDECCEGKCSLLHFVVVLILAGVTILIVGVVQYKEEAELFKFRKLIVLSACAVLATGVLLFIIKCACFCRARNSHLVAETGEGGQRQEGNVQDKNSLEKDQAGGGDKRELGEVNSWVEEEAEMELSKLISYKEAEVRLSEEEGRLLRDSERIVQAEVEIVRADA